MKRFYLIFFLIMLLAQSVGNAEAQCPKREFRGAWLHTVFQTQYHDRSTAENKKYLREQLDALHKAGVNAVIFQVRPQADAFYYSSLEPWSRYLTDDGKEPVPAWDPLEFMIEEAHARGMELHAWLNPYRVTAGANQTLPANHIYHKHPERFVRYDDKLYFDPAIPENREFICEVVKDIITRYDVDGIHFDDYFYPYPVKGKDFPDSKSYARYGKQIDKGDWRRNNVDKLIEGVHKVIKHHKPWVVFGISPFGIWRNEKSDKRGSKTNGLQNYDELYADVLLWARKGWIDYLLPQLYWELEHKSASYLTLVDWWNENAEGRNMYIGQDVNRTMTKPDIAPSAEPNQLRRKVELTRAAANIQGNCWWPAYDVTANKGGVADALASEFQRHRALWPLYPWISKKAPDKVKSLKTDGDKLIWNAPECKSSPDDAVKFAVYYFRPGEEIDLDNPEKLVGVTWKREFPADQPGIYAVTSISRVNNESKPVIIEK